MKRNILDIKLASMFVISLIIVTSSYSAIVISESRNEITQMEKLGDSLLYQQKSFEENNGQIELSPHLTSIPDDGDFDVSLQPAGQPIYDESMTAFHEIPLCHTVARGAGAVVMVIDLPVDYRHDIFAQEGYTSLTADNCYLVDCDYCQPEVNEITKITPYDVDTDFADYFDLSTGFLSADALHHGTAVAGLVKQVAPEATIISMGVPITGGDLLIEAHVKALDWAIAYCIAGNELDIITISSFGDSSDQVQNVRFKDNVLELTEIHKVLFTMSVDHIEGINLGDYSLYGSMGNEEGVIGVGQIYDEGFFLRGVRASNAHNHANHPDFMDLELMASGQDITTSLPVIDGLTNRIATNIDGTSYATPIVAGAAALLSGGMVVKDPFTIERCLIDYAIPGKIFDLSYNDADYPLYYGYGILNIVGTLCLGDFDRDGLTDFEEKFPNADGHCTDPFDGDSDDDGIVIGKK